MFGGYDMQPFRFASRTTKGRVYYAFLVYNVLGVGATVNYAVTGTSLPYLGAASPHLLPKITIMMVTISLICVALYLHGRKVQRKMRHQVYKQADKYQTELNGDP